MSRKAVLNLVLALALLAAAAAAILSAVYYANLPQRTGRQETILIGQSQFAPGSQAGLRVLVRENGSAKPLEGALVRLALRPQAGGPEVELFRGTAGADGAVAASFRVPQAIAPEQILIVETRSSLGIERSERAVSASRDYRVLLSTDKPVYQPGQVIHLRALALSAFDQSPAAGQTIELTIADGKGNKVFRKSLTTSEFGAAWTDFQLAGEVNSGDYKISAALGEVSSEKTVTVEYYVLPKFKVALQTDRSYYLPGQHVSATLQADYFFGKPVAGGKVILSGYTFDVQRNDVFRQELSTDEQGQAVFEFDLPPYLVGSDLEGGLARFYLQAEVTDTALHTENGRLSLPISASGLVLQAVPEGGVFRPGLDNILYLMSSYPDGMPAPAQLRVTFLSNNQTLEIETGAYGSAELHVTPASNFEQFVVEASTASGQSARREFVSQNPAAWSEEWLLLRPERPVYKVGETLNLSLFATQPEGAAYLDIVRGGQTLSTRSIPIQGGKGSLAVDLTPELYGTLELHAYKILSSGTMVRDTRLVVVDPASDLTVRLSAGQETYRPGDTAGLSLQVSGADGQGVQAALGLAVVDEAVFALQESDPGFARLYFLLESQLLSPRYDLHGLSLPELLQGGPLTDPLKGAGANNQAFQRAVNQAASASLSEVARERSGFSLQLNSHAEGVQRALQLQRAYFQRLSLGLYAAVLALAGGLALLVGLDLWRRKVLGRSLLTALGLISFLGLLFLLLPLPAGYEWAVAPFDRLGALFSWLSGPGAGWLGLAALAGLAGYLALAGMAITRRDLWLGWTVIFLPFFVLGLFGLAITGSGQGFSQAQVGWLVAAFLLAPLVVWVRMAAFWWEKRPLAGLAALPLAFFLLAGLIPASQMGLQGAAVRDMRLDGGNVVGDGMMEKGLAMPEVAMAPAPTQAPAAEQAVGSGGSQPAAQPPRLRQYFPETMAWIPDALTAPDGSLRLDLPVADSITTWRVTGLASSRDGRLGTLSAPLRVFQDFFVDLDLPVSLTVGDEVSLPVAVYNYQKDAQNVRLEIVKADWFELSGDPVQTLAIGANDVRVAYFRVRARAFGLQAVQVNAAGTTLQDAIRKEVRVYPDGKPISISASDRLQSGVTARQTITIPAAAVSGTQNLRVKLYPGVLSQVVEGLDGILRMPNGCFEQTSSSTYPNLLVLDYLRSTRQSAPALEMKAEEYINLGYQRLLTFEVQSSGGFSLFGEVPADRMLTAYGLQEFSDMSKVHSVDPAVLGRAAAWLASQQAGDGSWENDRGLVHESTWSSLGNDRLPVTAYIVWSLVEAGFGGEPAAMRGLDYLRENQAQVKDAYVAALVANALVAGDLVLGKPLSAPARAGLDRLAGMAQRSGQNAFWQSGIATFVGGEGQTASIETTAMAAFALLRAEEQPELATAALGFLVSQKDSFGTWHSTQATVLALKALLQSVRAGGEQASAQVTVTLNGGQSRTLAVTPENFDVLQQVSFEDVPVGRENVVEIRAEGKGNLMYQVAADYYLPWDQLQAAPQNGDQKDLLSIQVSYDRAELAVEDTLGVTVRADLTQPGARAEQAMLDLGIPPGFSVLSEDLDGLVQRYLDQAPAYDGPRVQRYELTGRQILLYVTNLRAGQPLEFNFRLRAKYPLRVQAPASSAYDYYNPTTRGDAAPVTITVK